MGLGSGRTQAAPGNEEQSPGQDLVVFLVSCVFLESAGKFDSPGAPSLTLQFQFAPNRGQGGSADLIAAVKAPTGPHEYTLGKKGG